jgi:two-component system chemotaxis sensor kinase CheA
MDEILGEFLAETFDSLETLEQLLLALETSSEASEPVRDAFRILHTIKGTSGFLGLERLQNVAHHCENLLSKVRDGELVFTPAMSSTLLKAMDTLKIILNGLSDQGNEAAGDDSGIVN